MKEAFRPAYDADVMDKNESTHSISFPHSKVRLRGKTAWNADTLRGDYADVLILDEVQLMDPSTWEDVGAPMLLDNDGDAIFIYTPPNPQHKSPGYKMARKLFERGQKNKWPLWASFHWTSADNPHVSTAAIERMARDMAGDSYQREILAEDTDEVPDALWSRELIDETRVEWPPDSLERVVVGVDPPGGATECGIVAAGLSEGHVYILEDGSIEASPDRWASEVHRVAKLTHADMICGESNFGGDMVKSVLQPILNDGLNLRYKNVRASRGKALRAEPVVARFERGEAHIVHKLPKLEDELCTWVPGSKMDSPNRLDAMVWAATELQQTRSAAEVW